MQVTFFGVRGSYPVPNKDMMEFGGKTSSVMFSKEVPAQGATGPHPTIKKKIYLFIDAGLGLIEAGKKIIPSLFDGTASKEMTILFTHLHPDHTEGFTFFAPNFIPGVKLNLLGPASLKKNVGMVLRDKMAPPTYPIEYKDLKSDRNHGIVEDGQIFYIHETGAIVESIRNKNPNAYEKPSNQMVFEVKVMQSFAPSHPQQGSIYYRITDIETQKSVACIWDIESRKGGDQRVIAFSKDADVMIHDTQYTEEEYDSPKMIVQGFGHSTYEMAVENAVLSNAKILVPFHYNPTHTDEKLRQLEGDIKIPPTLKVQFSKEGLVLDL